MSLLHCPVGFFEGISAAFQMKKKCQIDPENDKIHKIFQFSNILCFFSKYSTNSVIWNVGKGQPGTIVVSNALPKSLLQVSI